MYSVGSVIRAAASMGFAAFAVPCAAQDAPPVAETAGTGTEATTPPETFMINAIDVLGVKSIPQGEIETIIYPFLGPDRTIKDVEAARKAIQDAYNSRGLGTTVVDIPVQPNDLFQQGVVQIAVVEVPIGQVRVIGSKYTALSSVRERFPSLAEGKPLDDRKYREEQAAADRSFDGEITPVFTPGRVPGTLDVDLKVKDSFPVHGVVKLDNDHSPSTSPLRVTAQLRYNNLWQLGHTLSATYIVAPQNRSESEVFAGSYSAPLLDSSWSIQVSGYTSNSNVAAIGGTNVLGNGFQIGGSVSYHLPATKTQQTLTVGADYKHFDQNIFVNTAQATSGPLRYVPVYVTYALQGAGSHSLYGATLGATFGVRAIKRVACFDPTATPANCIPQDQFANRDFDSQENFVHFNATLDYTYTTGSDFVFAGRVAGQYSDSHLVTNEQFSVGGLDTVRGYLQTEVVGDDGFTGSLEFQLPSVASRLGPFFDELRLYGFGEGGYVGIRRALPGQDNRFSLASVGGGVRLRVFKHISGEVNVGVPLASSLYTDKGDPRVTFVAKGEF